MSVNPKLAVQPDLAFLVDLIRRGVMISTNCHALGTIQSFDSSNQSAQVTLNYKRVVNGEAKSYPVLADCPVIILQGGGGRLTFPIEPGDNCLILFNDVNMDTWVSSGNTGAPPTDARSHAFADAIVLVGLNSLNNPLSDYFEDGVELASTDGASLQLTDKIKLLNSATDLRTALTQLTTALSTFATATSVAVIEPTLGPASAALVTALSTYSTTLASLLE